MTAQMFHPHRVASVTGRAVSAPARLVATDARERFLLIAPVPGEPDADGHPDRSAVVFEIDAVPAVDQAERWEHCVRRIVRVTLCRSGGDWTSQLQVIGHRRPTRHGISVATALALGLRGHRLHVCAGTLADATMLEGLDDGRLPL